MAQITADAIRLRRGLLQEQEKAAWANLNAILGAIQDCDYWLEQAEAPEPDEAPAIAPAHLAPVPESSTS